MEQEPVVPLILRHLKKFFFIAIFFGASGLLSSCKSDSVIASEIIEGVISDSELILISSSPNVKIFSISNETSYIKLKNQSWLGEQKSNLSETHGLTWNYPIYAGRAPRATVLVIVGYTVEHGNTVVISDV